MTRELGSLQTHSLLPSLPPPLLCLLPLLLLLLQLASTSPTARTQLVPDGFSCTRDMPRRSGIYSTPTNSSLAKVDLIHTFCGQIEAGTGSTKRVGGFHARPGASDPASASTLGPDTQLIRAPPNQCGYAVYKYPYVFDSSVGSSVRKNTSSISSMWPTVLSMEGIVQAVTELVYSCRPSQGKHLCVMDYSVVQGGDCEVFDVVVIMWNKSRVVRSAYPARQGTCVHKSSSVFDVCSYNYTTQR